MNLEFCITEFLFVPVETIVILNFMHYSVLIDCVDIHILDFKKGLKKTFPCMGGPLLRLACSRNGTGGCGAPVPPLQGGRWKCPTAYLRTHSQTIHSLTRALPRGSGSNNLIQQDPVWLLAHFFCLFVYATEQAS